MFLLAPLFPKPNPASRIRNPALKLLQPLSSYGQQHNSHYSKHVDGQDNLWSHPIAAGDDTSGDVQITDFEDRIDREVLQ